MKKYVLKSFAILVLGSSLLQPVNAHALSSQSQIMVGLAAGVGGLVTGTLGYFVRQSSRTPAQRKKEERESKNESTWKKIKRFPWAATLIPAAIGSAVSGCIAYSYTPEKTIEWCDKQLADYEKEFNKIENCQNITDLKSGFARNSYPSIATYKRLENLEKMLMNLYWYADKAAHSGIASLSGIAQQCIDKIVKYHEAVTRWMIQIKSDKLYWKESAVQSQHQLAQAASTAATSMLIKSLQPKRA